MQRKKTSVKKAQTTRKRKKKRKKNQKKKQKKISECITSLDIKSLNTTK